MKRTFKTSLMIVAVLGLAACAGDGLGDFQDAPPYSDARTATHTTHHAPAPEPAPAPAPVAAPAPTCGCDCDALSTRASSAENKLAMCMESKSRVTGALKDELAK